MRARSPRTHWLHSACCPCGQREGSLPTHTLATLSMLPVCQRVSSVFQRGVSPLFQCDSPCFSMVYRPYFSVPVFQRGVSPLFQRGVSPLFQRGCVSAWCIAPVSACLQWSASMTGRGGWLNKLSRRPQKPTSSRCISSPRQTTSSCPRSTSTPSRRALSRSSKRWELSCSKVFQALEAIEKCLFHSHCSVVIIL